MAMRFDDQGMLLPNPMEINRIPLPDDFVRLEALKAAIQIESSRLPSIVIDTATAFESYIRDGKGDSVEYHDDETLHKVYDVLRAHALPTEEVTDVVSELQNRGILFRERR